MAKLALSAARSRHRLMGLRYNDSIPINLHSEIKINILELKLPLGCKCIFLTIFGRRRLTFSHDTVDSDFCGERGRLFRDQGIARGKRCAQWWCGRW